MKVNVYFYLIKGTSTFNSWKDGSSVSFEKQYFGTSFNLTYQTYGDEDDYYFIWDNTASGSYATGMAYFTINMKVYDISNPLETCGKLSCDMMLTKGSTECIIIMGMDSVQPDDVYQVTYTLSPRQSYYWTIFGVVLAIVVLIVAGVIVGMYLHFRRASQYYTDPATVPIVQAPIVTVVDPIPPPGYAPTAPPPVNPYYNT